MTANSAEDVKSLEELLVQGQRLSMQGSYERRAPAPDAVPFLVRARDGLKEMATRSSSNPQVWQLLSLAHEALLEYGPALAAAQEAVHLSGRKDKRDLKRMARLREGAAQWNAMPLSPAQLAQLGEYLRDKLAGGSGDRTLRWTEAWLLEHRVAEPARVIAAFRNRGGFTDFQVLSNVVA
jgi:hypothetical protein